MSRTTQARHFVRGQARMFRNVLNGGPPLTPSLVSMTLDLDDVYRAEAWLANRSRWMDRSVVAEYEAEFARWNGSAHALAVMSGRVALSACIHALRLKCGDEVVLPGYTCVVVANACRFAGLKVIFCDIELETYGLEIRDLERKVTRRTRAIIIQHLFGVVCRDYEAILDFAKRKGLRVIEDCAHATGAEFKGIKVGNRGDLAFYSSEQSKVFNTIQGGMAVTDDEDLAEGLRNYQSSAPDPDEDWIERQLLNVPLHYYQLKHPQRWVLGTWAEFKYGPQRLISTTKQEEQGLKPTYYGRKMPAPIAALGLNQLKKIDRYNEQRRTTAEFWDHWCDSHNYDRAVRVPESLPVFLRYPVLVPPEMKKNRVWALKELAVDPGVWFVSHLHPATSRVPDCPSADRAVAQCINLPTLGVLP